MAVFVVVPSGLEGEAGIARERHALAYLGALVLSVPGIYFLVRGRRYLSAPTRTLLLCLFVLLSGLIAMSLGGFMGTLLGLLLFFTGFTALEAMLPSLASIYAPAASRGTAMGFSLPRNSLVSFLAAFSAGLCLSKPVGWVSGWVCRH